MASLTLVVMAAGIGSRYGGLKQVDSVGPKGEIVIDYSIYDALLAGFDKIVFIIRPDMEKTFREKVGRKVESRAETAYVFQKLENYLPAGFTVPPSGKSPGEPDRRSSAVKRRSRHRLSPSMPTISMEGRPSRSSSIISTRPKIRITIMITA